MDANRRFSELAGICKTCDDKVCTLDPDCCSELAKWTRKHDDADLQGMKKQADQPSLAAKQAYINALVYYLRHAEDENKRLRELVDGARVIVEVFQWSTPAQERWREEWLNKAREALKEASHE